MQKETSASTTSWVRKKILLVGSISIFFASIVHAAAELVDSVEHDHNRRLLHAADNGDVGTVKSALRKGADVDVRNSKGFTPLMFAARRGYEYVVAALIQAKANVNAESYDKETTLGLAIATGSTNVAERLVDAGANMHNAREYIENGKGLVRKDALLQAAEAGHCGIVRMLLEKKADVNKKNEFGDGETALMLAVARNRKTVITELIYADADETCTDLAGRTVQDYMTGMQPHWRVVQFMTNIKANAAEQKKIRAARAKEPFNPATGEATLLSDDNYKPQRVPKRGVTTRVDALRVTSRAGADRGAVVAKGGADVPPPYECARGRRPGVARVEQALAAAQEVYAAQHAAAEAAKNFACELAKQDLYNKAGMVGQAHKVMVIECPLCTFYNQEDAHTCEMCGMKLQS